MGNFYTRQHLSPHCFCRSCWCFSEFNRPTQSASREEEMFCTVLLWLQCLDKAVLPLLLSLIFLSVTRMDHNLSLLKYPTEKSTTLIFDRTTLLCCTILILHCTYKLELGVTRVYGMCSLSLSLSLSPCSLARHTGCRHPHWHRRPRNV